MKKLILLASMVLASPAVFAQVFTLTDGNSSVSGDAGGGLLSDWLVDGVDHLFNQDYFYRIGTVPEVQMSTVGPAVLTSIAPNIVNIAYANAFFRFDITYTLIGGAPGSGTADIGEIVRVQNLTGTALDFHLFEYDDFDLNGTAGGDTAFLVNGSTIQQVDGLTEVMVGSVPPFSRWEIATWPTIIAKLNDGVADNLSNTGSPTGPGDVAFAMQWDRVIGPGGTFLMSKNKRVEVVPEPATIAALGLGVAALLRRRRK